MAASDAKLQPVLLVKPGSVSREDIQRAETLGGFCIIECDAPDFARFVEAPLGATLDDQAQAGLALVRWIAGRGSAASYSGGELVKFFVEALTGGSRIQTAPHVKRPAKGGQHGE